MKLTFLTVYLKYIYPIQKYLLHMFIFLHFLQLCTKCNVFNMVAHFFGLVSLFNTQIYMYTFFLSPIHLKCFMLFYCKPLHMDNYTSAIMELHMRFYQKNITVSE